MNYGPLIFLAAIFALSTSWFGLVLTPQLRIGQLQATNAPGSSVSYPVARPGLAQQGLQVYRANGCAYCHSQQVGQTRTDCDVTLTDAGTNHAAVIAALRQIQPSLSDSGADAILSGLPQTLARGATKESADKQAKLLVGAGAKAFVSIVPAGPDIARGWGRRRTVAEDYLFDSPVMLGSQRVGPDLANIGVRKPDENWHLRHLYAPRMEVKNSTMPPYRFLFEKRRIERKPSPDALALPKELAPEPGFEIVPRPEAIALVGYLLSLRADTPLFDAPMTVAALASATTTNVPASAPPQATAP